MTDPKVLAKRDEIKRRVLELVNEKKLKGEPLSEESDVDDAQEQIDNIDEQENEEADSVPRKSDEEDADDFFVINSNAQDTAQEGNKRSIDEQPQLNKQSSTPSTENRNGTTNRKGKPAQSTAHNKTTTTAEHSSPSARQNTGKMNKRANPDARHQPNGRTQEDKAPLKPAESSQQQQSAEAKAHEEETDEVIEMPSRKKKKR